MLTFVINVISQVWTIKNTFRPDDTQIFASGSIYWNFKMADIAKPAIFEKYLVT